MKSAQAAPPFMDRGRVEDELRGRGCDILFGAVPPRTCQGTLERNRELCASNVCGSYGTNWGCPPGSGTAEECIGSLRSYGSAAIVIKRFPETDPGDPDLMASLGKDFQDACRAAKHMMEECGHRCLVLSDGGCMYWVTGSATAKNIRSVPIPAANSMDAHEILLNSGVE